MEYNNPNEIVKTLTFGNEANSQIIAGVEKLANAVKSTLELLENALFMKML